MTAKTVLVLAKKIASLLKEILKDDCNYDKYKKCGIIIHLSQLVLEFFLNK